MSDLRNAASVRLIQVWTLFLSKLGSSGFLSARAWLVWLARAADTAASVASLDWRSLSSVLSQGDGDDVGSDTLNHLVGQMFGHAVREGECCWRADW